jgi:NAD-dependent DNA ligase
MPTLVEWAREYEEGTPVVTDAEYDGTVANLKWLKQHFPDRFHLYATIYKEFEDGSWEYTGTFYKGTTQ